MEAGIISAARSAGLQMAAFRARQWDDPEGAVKRSPTSAPRYAGL